MKKVKIGFLLLCMAAVLIAISGCSGNGNNNSGDQNENSANSSEDQVNLKFWIPGNSPEAEKVTEEIITAFEKENPNIKVEYSFIPWAEYFQKLTVSYAGSVEPDIHGLGFGQLISTVNQDKYMDLTKFIEADNWDGTDDFYPDLLKAGQWEGGQYGLLHADIRPFSWRKDLFKEADLDPESPPQTIDQVFEYAKKLNKVENGRTIQAGIDIPSSNGEQAYMSLALPIGLDYYDENGTITFDSPENIALVQRITDLYKEGVIINANQADMTGTPYQQGMAAMGFPSPGTISNLVKTIGIENVGLSVPPAGPDGKRTAFLGGAFITMSKTTDYPEESWEFMKYWFQPDNLLAFSDAIGFIPARQSLKEEYSKLDPLKGVLMDALSDSQGYKPSASWAVINKYMRIALEESYYEQKTVEEAMKSNAQKAREELNNE